MWKETKVIKNVEYGNFDARYGAYATNETDNKSMLYIASKEFPIKKATRVRSYDDKVVVQTKGENSLRDTMLFTKDGELLNVVKNIYPLNRNTNLRYMNVLVNKGENSVSNNNLVDIETGEMIFKDNYPETRFVFGNMIFTNENNIVTRYDWDGSILWQHNYELDFNVKINLGFVMEGVCGGKLWVKSDLDWHEILLAIDVNTGKLIKAFSDSEEDTNLPHCNLGRISNVYLNSENDQILVLTLDKDYGLFMNFVDAKTLKVLEKRAYAIDLDYDNDIENSLGGVTGFQGDYITFWLRRLHVDSMPSGFAVYNYRKKEVVFAHRLFTPEQTRKGCYLWGNTTQIPFYNNGLIFVHDNCDTLHIFEDVKE